VEWNSFWYFNIFNNSLTSIFCETSWIKINSEAVSGCTNNLYRFNIIYLSHTLNFTEYNIVTFLIRMTFIFMNSNQGCCSFFNRWNNKVFGCLTIMISNNVSISIVYKCVTPRSKSLGANITTLNFTAERI
jgi:hypothetical protein